MNPHISESAFIQRAGYGENSRGYQKLIKNGKRNISHKGILGFVKALKLNEKEAIYFENLVRLNQIKNDEERSHHFKKIQEAAKNKTSRAYVILQSQYHYFSKWYFVAIRELVKRFKSFA